MIKVFLDNDVILDLLLERKEYNYSIKIFELIETGIVKGKTSPVIFANTFYILGNIGSINAAHSALVKLRKILGLVKVDDKIVDQVLNSRFKDFEDAIQYFSALKDKCDYLVTRNTKDYIDGELKVVSPKELLALLTKN